MTDNHSLNIEALMKGDWTSRSDVITVGKHVVSVACSGNEVTITSTQKTPENPNAPSPSTVTEALGRLLESNGTKVIHAGMDKLTLQSADGGKNYMAIDDVLTACREQVAATQSMAASR